MTEKKLIVLAIDTATSICSVALLDSGKLRGENLLCGQKNHSEKLAKLIDELYKNTEVLPESIDLIAVSSGPGSFTGLRVGISTAQGLAFALGKDLIGISTLDVLAYQAGFYSGYICPMIDARKQQVYTCLYKSSEDGRMEKTEMERVVDPEKWLLGLREHRRVLFTGDGARMYNNEISSVLKGKHIFLPCYSAIPRASVIACIAHERYKRSNKNEPAKITPLYVRVPEAELNTGAHGGVSEN